MSNIKLFNGQKSGIKMNKLCMGIIHLEDYDISQIQRFCVRRSDGAKGMISQYIVNNKKSSKWKNLLPKIKNCNDFASNINLSLK